jgi:hypothetical protein
MPLTPHLAEHRLFECSLARQTGEPIDPPAAEHLADCPECAAAFNEFVSVLQSVRADGESDADRIFTPERLRAQQASIDERLRHVGRLARVISFPSRGGDAGFPHGSSRTTPRWIAAAAAAGLFIGVALGASYQWELRAHGPSALRAVHGAPTEAIAKASPAVRALGAAPSAADEDAFLSDLEAALDRPRTRELQPFDALTPHVRDVRSDFRAPGR